MCAGPTAAHRAGSRFGAVLDMVTDRSTTAGLLCHLCVLYPAWTLAFQLLLALDLSSHYMHMYRYVLPPPAAPLTASQRPLLGRYEPQED